MIRTTLDFPHQPGFPGIWRPFGHRGLRVTFRHSRTQAASRLLGGVLLAAALALPAVASELAEDAPAAVKTHGEIEIAVAGTQMRVGTVRVNLYASKEAFLESEDAQAEVAVADEGASVVTFRDLAQGSYAAVAYQDINGNGKLDRGLYAVACLVSRWNLWDFQTAWCRFFPPQTLKMRPSRLQRA